MYLSMILYLIKNSSYFGKQSLSFNKNIYSLDSYYSLYCRMDIRMGMIHQPFL
jgi:hypothetical protein